MVYPSFGAVRGQARHRGVNSYSVVLPGPKGDSIPFKRYIVGDGEVSYASEEGGGLDGWERVWRDVNSTRAEAGSRGEGEGEEGEVDGGMDGERDAGVGMDGWGCAVLDPGDGASTARLWVFGNPPLETLHGLQEEEASGGLLEVNKTFECTTHGHDYACLRPGSRCLMRWHMDSVVGWDVFACALAEKQAWGEERRLVTRPAPGGAGIKEECRLWPISQDKLLLVVTPVPKEVAVKETSTRSTSVDLQAVTVHPLAIPALHIAAFSPTSSEQQALESSFAEILGSSWMISPEGHQLDVELGCARPEWGVYWVPFDGSSKSAADLASGQGVMALWPTSLVTESSSNSTVSPQQASTALPALGFPTPGSMMDVAAGLFDFMSTYDVPVDITEATPESQPPPPAELSAEESAQSESRKSNSGSPARSENSDLDDLFEDRSGEVSPAKVPADAVEIETDEKVEGGGDGDLDDFAAFDLPELVGLDTDIVMSSPGIDPLDLPPEEDRPRGGEPLGTVVEEEDQDQTFVTEDDFNFFDSPGEEVQQQEPVQDAQDAESRPEALVIPQIAEPVEVVDEVGISPARSTVDFEPVHGGDATSSGQGEASHSVLTPPPDLPPPPPTLQVVNVDDGRVIPLEPSPAPGTPSPPTPLLDLVPSPFAPLPNITPASSFPYSLPTPATTPESLRTDLLDRLKSKEKYDYAAQWDIESVDESMEEDEEYTGAPPTPISFIDSETLPSRIPTPKIDGVDGLRDRDIMWEGVPLVGVDLIKIQWDSKALSGVARGWSDSWIRGRSKGIQASKVDGEKKAKVLEGVEVGRLVEEVVSNRFLRDLVIGGALESKDETGNSIADLDLGLELKALPQVTIHAGLSSHIAQLSIASLRYWRQLGLQPSGGRKDVTSYVVCDVGDGITRAASSFISQMAATYDGCLLGTHAIGEAGASQGGVVSVPPAGFIDSITGLVNSSTADTVVYVVLPELSSRPFTQLLANLLSSKIAQSPTSFIKILPPSALNTRDAQSIAFEVYERLSRPIRPIMLRGVPMEPLSKHAQYPAFTLSTPVRLPKLSLAWPLDSYDVLNRCRTIHCAFAADPDLGRAVAVVMDSEGEGWRSKVVAFDERAASIPVMVIELLIFYLEFARKSAVDFRLAICFPAPISRAFLKAWKITMDSSPYASSVIIVDGPRVSKTGSKIRPPVVPVPPSTYADSASRAVDESLAGHWAILPRIPIPVVALPNKEKEESKTEKEAKSAKERDKESDKDKEPKDNEKDDKDPKDPKADKEDTSDSGDADNVHIYPLASFSLTMPTPSLSGTETSTFHVLQHRPLPSSAPASDVKEDPEELYAGEYHRLACLGRTRFGLDGGVAHVEAARLGLEALRAVGGGGAMPSASAAVMAAAAAAGSVGNGSAGGAPGVAGAGEANGAAAAVAA